MELQISLPGDCFPKAKGFQEQHTIPQSSENNYGRQKAEILRLKIDVTAVGTDDCT